MFVRYGAFGLATLIAVAWGLRGAADPGADLKAAIEAVQAKKYAVAAPLLGDLRARLPQLADYAAWYLATTQSELKNYAAVPASLDAVFQQEFPRSPLRGRAAVLAGDAYLKLNQPKDAIAVLRDHYNEITAPQADALLADAYLASGDKLHAAVYYQRVYFGYPQSQIGRAHV